VAYDVRWTREAWEHRRSLSAGERRLADDGIARQLRHEPARPTRNRKPLRANPLASWALRIRDLRIFYEIVNDDGVVWIVALGRKRGNIVMIAGEEVRLEGD
jgi:mRNA interferase RelE/StbE